MNDAQGHALLVRNQFSSGAYVRTRSSGSAFLPSSSALRKKNKTSLRRFAEPIDGAREEESDSACP